MKSDAIEVSEQLADLPFLDTTIHSVENFVAMLHYVHEYCSVVSRVSASLVVTIEFH